MTARRPVDPLLHRFRLAGALVFVVMGAGFLCGPDVWRSSPSYTIIRAYFPWGVRGWGLVFLLLGVAQHVTLLRHDFDRQRILAIAGGGIVMAWVASFVVAMFFGNLTGWSGIPMWAFFAFAQMTQARRIQNRAE